MPRREGESRLGLMHAVELLRVPLMFSRAHANFTLSEGGAVATNGAGDGYFRVAASEVAMRSGRHYAQFSVLANVAFVFGVLFGVIQADWDVEGGPYAYNGDGHCVYETDDGNRYPGNGDWEGKQTAREPGDRIGMLLDLDQAA